MQLTLSIFYTIKLMLLCFLLSSCSTPNLDIEFFAYNHSKTMYSTDRFLNEKGNLYGWIMYFDSDDEITWREELFLPKTPDFWSGEKAKSPYNIRMKKERPVFKDGRYVISKFWSVEEGDPLGVYQFSIYVQGRLVISKKMTAIQPINIDS